MVAVAYRRLVVVDTGRSVVTIALSSGATKAANRDYELSYIPNVQARESGKSQEAAIGFTVSITPTNHGAIMTRKSNEILVKTARIGYRKSCISHIVSEVSRMSDISLPVPPGPPGIAQRGQVQLNAATRPLSVEEMWTQLVQDKRGFTSSSSGAGDSHRSVPATLPPGALKLDDAGNPASRGAPLGKGYETYAGLQLIDEDGRRVALAADHFGGAGPDDHAEARSIRALEKHGPARLENGKLIVVSDQEICPGCRQRIVAYAEKRGLSLVEPFEPERPKMVGAGMASPKTTSRSSTQGGRPAVKLVARPPIKITRIGGLPPGQPRPPSKARTALVGTLASIGAGVALNLLTSAFKEQMLRDLERMPKPVVDRRNADTYFRDPAVRNGIRVIDLFERNLDEFGSELETKHTMLKGGVNIEVALLAVSAMADPERLNFVRGMEDELGQYVDDLLIVRENVDAAVAMEARLLEAAKGARELVELVETGLVLDWLLKAGFTVEEISRIHGNLKSFDARVRRLFIDMRRLKGRVDVIVEEANALAHTVNKLGWSIFGGMLAAEMKRTGVGN